MGLSQSALGPLGPRKATLLTNSGPASLAACRSLAGPGGAVEARGLLLTCSSHCQGSASTGMYGQDGSLHYNAAGNRPRKWEEVAAQH